MIRGKLTSVNTFVNKNKTFLKNELTYQLRKLGKEPQNKLKESTRKEIVKIKAENNEL